MAWNLNSAFSNLPSFKILNSANPAGVSKSANMMMMMMMILGGKIDNNINYVNYVSSACLESNPRLTSRHAATESPSQWENFLKQTWDWKPIEPPFISWDKIPCSLCHAPMQRSGCRENQSSQKRHVRIRWRFLIREGNNEISCNFRSRNKHTTRERDRQTREHTHTAHEDEAPGLEPGVDEKKLCMNEWMSSPPHPFSIYGLWLFFIWVISFSLPIQLKKLFISLFIYLYFGEWVIDWKNLLNAYFK